MSDNVMILKLVSGEEVIAEVTNTLNGKNILIENPLLVVLQPREDGRGFGVMLAPFAMGVEGKINVNADKLVFVESPKKELLEQYNKVFNKIQVVPAGILVPK
jgi:hypothetical protein